MHKAYDEATAILAGDGLLTLAFDVIADPRTHRMGRRAAIILQLARSLGPGGMVGGQIASTSPPKGASPATAPG